MKFYFLVSFFLSSLANACPNLTGTYLCQKSDLRGESLYTYSQVPVGDHWQFTMTAKLVGMDIATSYQFVTDGVERELTDGITGTKILATATCDSSALTIVGTANLDKPNKIKFSEILSLSPEGDLEDYSDAPSGVTLYELCKRQSN